MTINDAKRLAIVLSFEAMLESLDALTASLADMGRAHVLVLDSMSAYALEELALLKHKRRRPSWKEQRRLSRAACARVSAKPAGATRQRHPACSRARSATRR